MLSCGGQNLWIFMAHSFDHDMIRLYGCGVSHNLARHFGAWEDIHSEELLLSQVKLIPSCQTVSYARDSRDSVEPVLVSMWTGIGVFGLLASSLKGVLCVREFDGAEAVDRSLFGKRRCRIGRRAGILTQAMPRLHSAVERLREGTL